MVIVMVMVMVMFRVKVIIAPAVVLLLLYMMLELAPIPFSGKGGSVASGGKGGGDGASRDGAGGAGRQERLMTASSGIDSRSMTLARSSAPSVARPSSIAGDSRGDLESEYLSKVSGRSKSRMGTQVCSKDCHFCLYCYHRHCRGRRRHYVHDYCRARWLKSKFGLRLK